MKKIRTENLVLLALGAVVTTVSGAVSLALWEHFTRIWACPDLLSGQADILASHGLILKQLMDVP